MKMLQGNVLVTEVEKEKTTAGGIILTDTGAIDKATQPALILAVCPEVQELGTVSPGDQVHLAWTEAQPINLDGEKAAIIHYKHIKAVL
mgnify:CR=1 FL=1